MVIALLTDFGTKDYFVGAIKGVILAINRNAKIIDITHEIPPQDVKSAGFTLRACYRNFPEKTIFVAVVDPGVGSDRRAILVETPEYVFIAPDNGLISFIFEEAESYRAFEITEKKYLAGQISRTFHGRDIFAPVAAHLSNGVLPEEFGIEINDFVRFSDSKVQKISENLFEAEIIHIDRFGNLITNFQGSDLLGKFYIEICGNIIKKHYDYFAEAKQGEIFSIAGSAGFLEIAAFRDSAQKLLNVKVGEKLRLFSVR